MIREISTVCMLRSRNGVMVPLGEVVTQQEIVSPATINHFNLFRSIKLEGQPAPGFSSGQLIQGHDAGPCPGGLTHRRPGLAGHR